MNGDERRNRMEKNDEEMKDDKITIQDKGEEIIQRRRKEIRGLDGENILIKN